MSTPHWTIVGQGLAGTCLAWELWKRDAPFSIIDREQGGSSRVAAGLINPVTGKNFEASKAIAEFLPQAMTFYAEIESILDTQFWHPHPILRLASNEKEWSKIQLKTQQPDVARWINPTLLTVDGWLGAIELYSGGRLDTRMFLDQSREFFKSRGIYQQGNIDPQSPPPQTIWCEGAAGLMFGRYGPHRCAKGEILTVNAPTWDENQIRIGGGGWLVPIGNHQFKVGSTYEWNQLDELPTDAGFARVHAIAQQLGAGEFEVTHHEAGIRPILRRSEPLIGPISSDQWMFNALGSKGSLYAPGIAHQLANWLIHNTEPDPFFNYLNFKNT